MTNSTRFTLGVDDVSRAAFESFKAGVAGAEAQLTELQREVAATSTTFTEFQTKLAGAAKFTKDLNFRVDSIGKTNADLTAMQAAQLGVANSAAPMIAKLREAEAANKSGGMSAAAYTNAMRNVPAQFTDIITSLQAGQRPMQVMLQQGGQLKDMFGGIGPAAKALGGYVLGLINPLTVAAGVAGVLAYAYHEAMQEASGFTKAIVMSGNAAGVTSAQLNDMAAGVAAIVGTQHGAAAVLAEMAASGQIAGDNLQRFAAVAIELERTAGVPIKTTVDNLAALGDAPVEASVRLNKQYHYLTAALYEQIKALEDKGQKDAAGELAQNAYADAMGQRAAQIKAHLGLLERGWQNLKDVAAGAWDAMLGVGRPQTMSSVAATIANLEKQIKERNAGAPMGSHGGELDARLAAARALSAELFRQSELESASAIAQKTVAEQAEAETEWRRKSDEFLTKKEKQEREIAAIEALGLKTGKSRAEIEQQIANIKKKNRDSDAESATKDALSGQIKALEKSAEVQELIAKRTVAEITHQYRMGAISQIQFIEQVAESEMVALQAKRDALTQEISIAEKKENSLKQVAALKGQRDAQDVKIDNAKAQRLRALTELEAQQARFAAAATAADLQHTQAEDDQYLMAQSLDYERLARSVADYAQSVKDANEQVDFEASLFGKTAHEIAVANEQRRIELRLRAEIQRIDKSHVSPEAKAALSAGAREAAAEAAAKVETKVWVDEWRQANQEIGGGLYDVLVHRGDDARRKLIGLFESLVLRPTIMGQLQPISGGLASAVTGNSSLASGSSSMAGGLLSGSSSLGAFSQAAGATMQNGLISGFGANMANAGTLMEGGSLMGALGVVAPYLAAAYAIYAIASSMDTHGGPKVEAGYAPGGINIAGIDIGGNLQGSQRGDIGAAQTISQGISASYTALAKQLGLVNQKLDVGVFYAVDNAEGGTSLTQLQVASKNYSRSDRLGGIENVARGEDALKAALTEETTRVIFEALKASDLPDLYKTWLNDIAQSAGTSEMQTAIDHVTQARTERTQLEATLFDLTATDLEKLNKTREAERAAIDPSNRALLEQVYAQQDLKTAAESTAAPVESLSDALARLRNPMRSVEDIAGNIIKLEGATESLRVELLRASGDIQAAAALQREIDTRGLTDAEIAIQDYNASLRAQIDAVNAAAAAADSLAERASRVWSTLGDAFNTFESAVKNVMAIVAAPFDQALADNQALIDAAKDAYSTQVDTINTQKAAAQEAHDLEREHLLQLKAGLEAAFAVADASLKSQITLLGTAEKERQKAYSEAAKAIGVQRDSAVAAYVAANDILVASIDEAGRALNKLQSLGSALTDTLKSMRMGGDEVQRQYRAAAQAQLSAALVQAKSGGALPQLDAIKDALTEVAKPSENLYASFEDYARDFYRTAIDISDLNRITGDQTGAAETTLEVLQSTKTAADAQHQQVLASLDAQRAALDAANEIAQEQYQTAVDALQLQRDQLAGKLQTDVSALNIDGLDAAFQATMKGFDQELKDAAKALSDTLLPLTTAADQLAADKAEALKPFSDLLAAEKDQTTALLGLNGALADLTKALGALDLAQATTPGGSAPANTPTEQWAMVGGQATWTSSLGAMMVRGDTLDTSILYSADRTRTQTAMQVINDVNAAVTAGLTKEALINVKAYGLSANSLDALMSWTPGTTNAYAAQYGLPSFEVGTNFVPHDMVAQIHKGERILPPADNANLFSLLSSGSRREEVLVGEIRALREEVARMRSATEPALGVIATNTGKTARQIDRWDGQGMPPVRAA